MYAVSSHEALMVQNHQDQDEEVGFIIEELGDNDIYRVYFCICIFAFLNYQLPLDVKKQQSGGHQSDVFRIIDVLRCLVVFQRKQAVNFIVKIQPEVPYTYVVTWEERYQKGRGSPHTPPQGSPCLHRDNYEKKGISSLLP